MEAISALSAVFLAALIVEKLVERIKVAAPLITGTLTSVVAVVLAVAIVISVPVVRVLAIVYGPDVEPIGDIVITSLAVAAGSGFLASLEGFFQRR